MKHYVKFSQRDKWERAGEPDRGSHISCLDLKGQSSSKTRKAEKEGNPLNRGQASDWVASRRTWERGMEQ